MKVVGDYEFNSDAESQELDFTYNLVEVLYFHIWAPKKELQLGFYQI